MYTKLVYMRILYGQITYVYENVHVIVMEVTIDLKLLSYLI